MFHRLESGDSADELTEPTKSSSPRTRSAASGAPEGATPSKDFQPFGAEVSEEKARQLKYHVKRLSPIHVSQRERTLGEISLGSASAPSVGDATNDSARVPEDEDGQDAESPKSGRIRAAVVRLSRVDKYPPSPTCAATEPDPCARVRSPEPPRSPSCPFGSSLVMERCDSPGYTESRGLSPSGRPVSLVDKLNVGDEVTFPSPVGYGAPGPDGSSEVLASMAAAAAGVALSCDGGGLTQAIMTRLDRPDGPFTDDSAESLALAAAVRDEVRSDGSDSGLGNEMPNEPCPASAAVEGDPDAFFLDRIPDGLLSHKDKCEYFHFISIFHS